MEFANPRVFVCGSISFSRDTEHYKQLLRRLSNILLVAMEKELLYFGSQDIIRSLKTSQSLWEGSYKRNHAL